MTAAPLFHVTDDLSPAFHAYAMERGLRGKELAETVRIIMRKIVFHAINNTPKGDRAKLLEYMERKVYDSKVTLTKLGANPSKAAAKRAARVERWRGTLAAWIVFKLNIYGARSKKPDQAFAAVNKWVMRVAFGTNLHRAGFIKARGALRVASSERLPRLKESQGDYQERIGEEIVDLLVENWASAKGPRSVGITGIAGDAIEKAFPSVEVELTERLFQKFTESAKKSGFSVAA